MINIKIVIGSNGTAVVATFIVSDIVATVAVRIVIIPVSVLLLWSPSVWDLSPHISVKWTCLKVPLTLSRNAALSNMCQWSILYTWPSYNLSKASAPTFVGIMVPTGAFHPSASLSPV